ncbi:MAG: sensor histidine kinase [Lachnospiraceae bacterium]
MDKNNVNKKSLKSRLAILIIVCLLPLTIMIFYLLFLINRFSIRYNRIVEDIAVAKHYDTTFKEDMDYLMYIIAVNDQHAYELMEKSEPYVKIENARNAFQKIYEKTNSESSMHYLKGIMKSLDVLEKQIQDIEKKEKITGTYHQSMNWLSLNIRIPTSLVQKQIQRYINDEITNLELICVDIHIDVNKAMHVAKIVYVFILSGAILICWKIVKGITKPIENLCEVVTKAGKGNFNVRAQEQNGDELEVLRISFNNMVERIGNLVENIRTEQLNLRATELRLLQAQINPHFLYNTLDGIICLAEAGEQDNVVNMVSALSDFFRLTLSKGQDYISVKEEKAQIDSYLEIQQYRYRDILEYRIEISEELYQYQMLKLTLQPLVENALYHGIKNKRRLGHIVVSGIKEGGNLKFIVWDDGIGMTAKRLDYIRKVIAGERQDKESSSGIGLYNVNKRLQMNYGEEYGLSVDSLFGEWTKVEVLVAAVKN